MKKGEIKCLSCDTVIKSKFLVKHSRSARHLKNVTIKVNKMKKKLRLKYRLEPIGEKGLEFQVLEMDESFRSATSPIKYKCKNGFSVVSDYMPDIHLYSKIVYLRGRRVVYDDFINEVYSWTAKDRNNLIKQIHAALKEWSVEWFKKEGK